MVTEAPKKKTWLGTKDNQWGKSSFDGILWCHVVGRWRKLSDRLPQGLASDPWEFMCHLPTKIWSPRFLMATFIPPTTNSPLNLWRFIIPNETVRTKFRNQQPKVAWTSPCCLVPTNRPHAFHIVYPLVISEFAMEHGLFIDDIPIRHGDCPWQMV